MPRYSDGKFQINADENGFITRIKGITKLGAIPEGYLNGQDADLSPVDICSEAIISLLKANDDQTIYHILNNNKADLSKLLGRMNPEILSNEEFKKRILESNDPSVQIFINYLRMLNSNENRIVNDITISKLETLGVSWNKYDIGYLKKILKLIKGNEDLKGLLGSENATPENQSYNGEEL